MSLIEWLMSKRALSGDALPNRHPLPPLSAIGRPDQSLCACRAGKVRALRRADRPKLPRRLGQIEKPGQIAGSARIREVQCALRDAEVEFDEPENTAEIVPVVVNVTRWGIGGD